MDLTLLSDAENAHYAIIHMSLFSLQVLRQPLSSEVSLLKTSLSLRRPLLPFHRARQNLAKLQLTRGLRFADARGVLRSLFVASHRCPAFRPLGESEGGRERGQGGWEI